MTDNRLCVPRCCGDFSGDDDAAHHSLYACVAKPISNKIGCMCLVCLC